MQFNLRLNYLSGFLTRLLGFHVRFTSWHWEMLPLGAGQTCLTPRAPERNVLCKVHPGDGVEFKFHQLLTVMRLPVYCRPNSCCLALCIAIGNVSAKCYHIKISNALTSTAGREKCQQKGKYWNLGTKHVFWTNIFCNQEIQPDRGGILLSEKVKVSI